MDETEKMDKQIRLRCTAVERAHIDKAAKEAGCTTVSDYVRSLLFDKHVLIVGPGDPPLTLIPAWSTDETAKNEALLMVRGMIALAETAQAVEADEAVLPPIFEEPAINAEPVPDYPPLEDVVVKDPAYEPFPPLPPSPVEESFRMPPPQLAAVQPPGPSDPNYPPPPLPVPAEIGPIPLPEENRNAFLNRRVAEMQLSGQSPLMAATVAEAEWRQAEAGPVVPPQAATVPRGPQEFPVDRPRGRGAPEPMSQNGNGNFDAPATHGFCGNCGHSLAGTPFCSACGQPA